MSSAGGPCVIVGASHAGVGLAAALRQAGWEAPIVVVGDEGRHPYERPPLSKAYLAGEREPASFTLRDPSFFAKHDVRLVDGHVVSLDREARTVRLADGDEFAYAKLALCTGASAVRLDLPGADRDGIHLLRTLADVEGIRADLAAEPAGARRVVLVGGGYIGLETAASLRGLGHDVTVLEAADRVLARVTSPEVSAFFTRLHREEGVRIETGVTVAGFDGDARVTGVRTGDGSVVPADLVIVGVGVRATTDLAAAAGLEVVGGIVVDACCRTADPDVVALGDCARVRRDAGRLVCHESVPNAREQAKVAAATLVGAPRPDESVPWFWSDQYDLTLQMVGVSTDHDQVVLRGDVESGRSFAAFYLDRGRLVGADCLARPREFVLAKKLIGQGSSPDPALLADESIGARDLQQRLLG